MNRVLLFFPSPNFGGAVQPRIDIPLSLLTIATPLDKAGYGVRIIDQRIDRDWKRHILEELKNGAICFGVTSMTGPQIEFGLQASKCVKDNSDIPVVWGGIHPTLMPEQTVRNEHIDIVVAGEGEETFFELAEALKDKRPLGSVKGIWYKQGAAVLHTERRPFIDLNKQSPLAYHLVDVNKYLVYVFDRGHVSRETSRGCPYRCAYCYNTNVYGSTWRSLSPDEAVRRLASLVRAYGLKGIFFSDDNFFGKKEHGMAVLRLLKKENLGILCSKIDAPVSAFESLSDEELRLLKEVGCHMIMVGIESGSPRIQRIMRKGIDIDRLLAFNRRLEKFGVIPLYLFMIGFPTETPEEMAQTVRLICRLRKEKKNAAARINIYTPFPGTGLFELAVQEGFRMPEKLEGWVSLNFRTVNAPWLSGKTKQLLRMLHFVSLLSDKHNFFSPYKKTNPLIILLGRLYYPIANLRFEKLYYRFPVELKIAEGLGLYPKQDKTQ